MTCSRISPKYLAKQVSRNLAKPKNYFQFLLAFPSPPLHRMQEFDTRIIIGTHSPFLQSLPTCVSGRGQPQAASGPVRRREEPGGVQPEDGFAKPAKLAGPGRLLSNQPQRWRVAKPSQQFGPGRESRPALQLAPLVAPRPSSSQPAKLVGGGWRAQQEPEEQPGPVDRVEDVPRVREREPGISGKPPSLFDTELVEEPEGERDEHGAGRSKPPEEPERVHSVGVLEPEPEELDCPVREIVAGEHRRERGGGAQRIDRGQGGGGGGEEPASRHRSRARDRQDAEGEPERVAGEERHKGEPDSAGSEEGFGRSR